MADINPNALLEFAKTITSSSQSKSGAKLATVTRVDENGVAYVQLPGGEETPIATTGAVYNIGDVVSVSMYGGKLRTVDNISAPSVSERIVRAAVKPVSKAVELAKKSASEAEAVANAVNQHFWDDDNGAHVTDVTKDEWKKAVDDNFSDASDIKPYSNLLMNSLGILLRSALNNLVSITRSAITFYDGTGNAASNIVARFGSDGAQIGKSGASHIALTNSAMVVTNYSGADNVFLVDGTNNPYLSLGHRDVNNAGTGYFSATFGVGNVADSRNDGQSVDLGVGAFAHGTNCTARGSGSFAGGTNSQAGADAFAHGFYAIASGEHSTAEGARSSAGGFASHAQNRGTIASSNSQTAIGSYNVEDTNGDYALIIGNGTADNARSNALAVKWDGTIEHAGDVAWTNLPLSSGWQAYSSNWTPKYRRVGQMVEVRGAVSPTAATLLDANDVTFANLPQGCRPTASVVHVCQSSGVKIWTLSITDAGEVRAGRLRTMNSTNYQSAGTSEWLAFDVTFLI